MADNKKSSSNTHTVTVEVSNDFDPGLEAALVRQLGKGSGVDTSNFVVGNFADLQRAGAAVIANGGSFADGVATHPDVDDAAAKAGAQRTLDEEAAAKAPAADPEPPKSDDKTQSVDPTSVSPEQVTVK